MKCLLKSDMSPAVACRIGLNQSQGSFSTPLNPPTTPGAITEDLSIVAVSLLREIEGGKKDDSVCPFWNVEGKCRSL